MNILKDKEIDLEKWNLLLKENKYSTPFQSIEYFDFFNSISNQSASVYALENENQILALCVVTFQKESSIKGFFSRRAIIYGGPLINEGEIGRIALNSLLSHINKELKKSVIYGEIRNFNDLKDFHDCFTGNGWEYTPYLNVQISILGKSTEDLLGAMKYNRKREISISYKEGAYTQEATTLIEVQALYAILKNLYDTRVASPLPPLEYFNQLFLSTVGKVFIVMHNENIIGGSFCIQYPDLSIYTAYYCGIRDYNKKTFPTHLAIMAAIEYGLSVNLQKIDLMGAGKPSEEYGVRRYKAEFGGEMVEFGRYLNIYNPLLFKLGNWGLKTLRKLKDYKNKLIKT